MHGSDDDVETSWKYRRISYTYSSPGPWPMSAHDGRAHPPSTTIQQYLHRVPEQLWMYYRSGTLICCCTDAKVSCSLTGGSTFLHEITSWLPSWKCDVKSKIRHYQSMHIYLKNNPGQISPQSDLKRWSFLKDGRPNNKKKNKMRWDQFLILKWYIKQQDITIIIQQTVTITTVHGAIDNDTNWGSTKMWWLQNHQLNTSQVINCSEDLNT